MKIMLLLSMVFVMGYWLSMGVHISSLLSYDACDQCVKVGKSTYCFPKNHSYVGRTDPTSCNFSFVYSMWFFSCIQVGHDFHGPSFIFCVLLHGPLDLLRCFIQCLNPCFHGMNNLSA